MEQSNITLTESGTTSTSTFYRHNYYKKYVLVDKSVNITFDICTTFLTVGDLVSFYGNQQTAKTKFSR